MAHRDVNSAHRLLYWRRWKTLPCISAVHEWVNYRSSEKGALVLTILLFLLVWPANLVQCALFNTLHSQSYAGMGSRGGMSRERFFVIAFVASTIYCTYSLSSARVFCWSFLLVFLRIRLSYDPWWHQSRYSSWNDAMNFFCFSDFLPGYLFTALSFFTWVCWIKPNDGKQLHHLISFHLLMSIHILF